MSQKIIYVTPDKVYVVRDGKGFPTMVVQNRNMANFFATADGGNHVIVPWYSKEKFDKDFAAPSSVSYENYEPSVRNPGDYVFRPIKKTRY